MTSMEFTFPTDPDGEVIARLHVVCPFHPDQSIAAYCLTDQGREIIETTPGFTSESVAGIKMPPTGRALLFSSHGHDPDGVAHFRHRFRCLRPTCGYDAKRRTDGTEGMHASTANVLSGMQQQGIREVTITRVDGTWEVLA